MLAPRFSAPHRSAPLRTAPPRPAPAQVRKTFVHKVGATHEARGYRADDWGIANPLMVAVMKVTSKDEACFVKLFQTGADGMETLLAECPIVLDADLTKKASSVDGFVEPVRDSSRYFVLMIKDAASGRTAPLGIGFGDRQEAFDFKAVLQDHEKFVKRQRAGTTMGVGDVLAEIEVVDRTLKEGEKISINMGNFGGGRQKRKPAVGGGLSLSAPPEAMAAPGGFLSAPPEAMAAPGGMPAGGSGGGSGGMMGQAAAAAADDGFDDDDFGDFTSA